MENRIGVVTMEVYKKFMQSKEQYGIAFDYLSVARKGQPTSGTMIWNYMFERGFQNWNSSSISCKMEYLISKTSGLKKISIGIYIYE